MITIVGRGVTTRTTKLGKVAVRGKKQLSALLQSTTTLAVASDVSTLVRESPIEVR